jgi:hypothetical protein
MPPNLAPKAILSSSFTTPAKQAKGDGKWWKGNERVIYLNFYDKWRPETITTVKPKNKLNKLIFLTLNMFCKIITPLAFLTLILNAAYSQITFEKIYGEDVFDCAYSVEQTPDGGYITAGTSGLSEFANSDIMIVKFDQYGNIQWSKLIDRKNIDVAYKIIQTNDGNYAISGLCSNSSSLSGFLIKINQSGDTIWCKEYEYFDWNKKVDVVQSNDGSYALVGTTNPLGAGMSNIHFTKVDESGNEIVSKTFGGSEIDIASSINVTDDQGYIIAGSSGYDYFYIIRTNADGDIIWTQYNYSEPGSKMAFDARQISGGDFIITGLTNGPDDDINQVYLLRVNSSGDILWSKTFEGDEFEIGTAVIQTIDGGFAITGFGRDDPEFGSQKEMDVFLIKTNELGDTIWTRQYEGPCNDNPYSIQQTPDKGFIICGTNGLSLTNYDAYLIKTDSNGMITPVYIHEMLDINEITVVPNPLIEKGTIKIAIKKAGSLNISLYDLSGLKIKTIFNENVQPGELSLNFDVRNLPSGVYYINLRNEEKTILKKIVKI